MTKGFVGLLAFSLVIASGVARADRAPGRSLPAGEEAPLAIAKIFASPSGEVQFLEGQGRRTIFLRTEEGDLFNLAQVRGSEACGTFVNAAAKGDLPKGCEFVLESQADGRVLTVKSEEMNESSLFESVKGQNSRGRGAHVSL